MTQSLDVMDKAIVSTVVGLPKAERFGQIQVLSEGKKKDKGDTEQNEDSEDSDDGESKSKKSKKSGKKGKGQKGGKKSKKGGMKGSKKGNKGSKKGKASAKNASMGESSKAAKLFNDKFLKAMNGKTDTMPSPDSFVDYKKEMKELIATIKKGKYLPTESINKENYKAYIDKAAADQKAFREALPSATAKATPDKKLTRAQQKQFNKMMKHVTRGLQYLQGSKAGGPTKAVAIAKKAQKAKE